jgi:outer membrane receptor for ferrienterochelin and colicins
MRVSKAVFTFGITYLTAFLCGIIGTAPMARAQDVTPPAQESAKNPIPPTANTVLLPDRLVARTEGGRQIYDADVFAVFVPQTAGDMIGRIPGFIITGGNSDRGLGEASENVLFNGQRISGKSNDARTVLNRTPASSVVRIEIADGATLNIPGLSGQVANIITKSTGIKGNFSYRSQIRKDTDPQYFSAELSLSGKLGKGDFTLGLQNNDNSFRGGGVGEEITTNGNGDVLFVTQRVNVFNGDQPKLTASYALTTGNGNKLNSNVILAYRRFRRLQTFDRNTINAPNIFDLSTGRDDGLSLEASADYEFALGGGRLKITGFQTLSRTPALDTFRRDFADSRDPVASRFKQISKDGESIFRTEYSWKTGRSDWQVSAEGAYNFLDVRSELATLVSGVFVPGTLSNATSRVAEKRGQIIATLGRPLAKNITLQTQIGGEYSQINQTGARGLTRQFVRPKGLVSLAWKASPVLDISARLERKVGQLNFGDFIASVDLRDNNNNAGNPELVPPQSWLTSLELNRSLGAAGSFKVKLERETFTDIVDQVPIDLGNGDFGEAPGNLDKAKRWSLEANGTFLLDRFGLKGAKVELSGYLQRGQLRDGLGFSRPINGERRYTYEINFRHDIPKGPWAYGVIYEDQRDAPFYRLDFEVQSRGGDTGLRAYIENRNIFGLRGRLAIVNVLDQKEVTRSIFYTAQRGGSIDSIRNGRQGSGTFARFSLSGTF